MINDIQKALIAEILASPLTTEALKQGLLDEVDKQKAPYDKEKTDQQNGAEARANERAKELIREGFIGLHKYEMVKGQKKNEISSK